MELKQIEVGGSELVYRTSNRTTMELKPDMAGINATEELLF